MKAFIFFVVVLVMVGSLNAQVITKSEIAHIWPQKDGRIDVMEVHTDSTGQKHHVFYTSPAIKGEPEAVEQVLKETMALRVRSIEEGLIASEKQDAINYALSGGDISTFPYHWLKPEDVKAEAITAIEAAKAVNISEKTRLDSAGVSAAEVGVKP